MEPVEVRLARIEEGIVGIHSKLDTVLSPVVVKQEKHNEQIVVLERDRWWVFSLTGASLLAALTALLKRFIA